MEDRYAKVLVVDDDTSILTVLKTLLEREGFDVVTADSSDKAYNILKQDEFDLMLSDIVMQPFDGIALLGQARKLNPEIQVIIMTGFANIETATKAMKSGAFDYICKPFKVNELQDTVKRAIKYIEYLGGEVKSDPDQPRKKIALVKKHFGEIVGNNESMKRVYSQINEFAASDSPLLISGQCGVGKALVGRAVHATCPRSAGPYLNFNCAICPEGFVDGILFGYVEMPTDGCGNTVKGLPIVKKGVFENAKGGTIHFEEIAALPMRYQEELSQILQQGNIVRAGSNKEIPIDVRIIADTTTSLESKVEKGEFLKGLFKLLQNRISIPKLADRTDDIQLLISHFTLQYNKQYKTSVSFAPGAIRAMQKYTWPGNVRELKSAVYRAAGLSKNQKVHLNNVPLTARMCYTKGKSNIFGYSDQLDLRWRSLNTFIKAKESECVEQVLKVTKGDKEKAANLMGISLAAFYRKYC